MKYILSIAIFIAILFSGLLIRKEFFSGKKSHIGRVQLWSEVKKGNPEKHPELNELFKPSGAVARHTMFDEKGPFNEAIYHLNQFGLREKGPVEKKKSHFIVSGCSFVFGLGIPEEETVTSYLGKKIPDINVYNMAFPGGGLHTSLRYFEIVNPGDFVLEREGVFAYVMIGNHLERFLRRNQYLVWARAVSPFYIPGDSGPQYGGTLGKTFGHKFVSFMKYFGLEDFVLTPKPITDQELEFFVSGVAELKKRYKQSFPDGRFVWITHSMGGIEKQLMKRLMKMAHEMKIEFHDAAMDFTELRGKGLVNMVDHVVKKDFHPSGIHNDYFSDWLISQFHTP